MEVRVFAYDHLAPALTWKPNVVLSRTSHQPNSWFRTSQIFVDKQFSSSAIYWLKEYIIND